MDSPVDILKAYGLLLGGFNATLANNRLAICIGCDKFSKIRTTCAASPCNCLMVAKARLIKSKCPLRKW